jgi:hypothetical protein
MLSLPLLIEFRFTIVVEAFFLLTRACSEKCFSFFLNVVA